MASPWKINNYSFGGVTLIVYTRATRDGQEFEVADEENVHRLSGMGEPTLDVLEGIARDIIDEQRKGIVQ